MKSLLLHCQLCDDLARQYPTLRKTLERDKQTLERRTENEGLSFLGKTLPRLCDAIFHGVETGTFTCPEGFKRPKGWAIPAFLQGMLRKLFSVQTGLFLGSDELTTQVICDLRQLLLFHKKLHIERDTIVLDNEAKRKFWETDDSIIGQPDNPLLEDIARVLWRPTRSDELYEGSTPRNGPGAVAEGLTPNEKYKHLLDNVSEDVCADFGFSFLETQGSQKGEIFSEVTTPATYAKLCSVPKSTTARRTITVEPACNMYMQQALNTVIRRRISKDAYLQHSISLDDQTKSQDLALASSKDTRLATVDLSCASDLLSNELVCRLFSHDGLLLKELQRFRTPFVECGNTVRDLRKYAGMGNATTFPIQTLVFTFICVKAVVVARSLRPCRGVYRSVLREIRVYGDDIIIPSDSYGALKTELDLVGLRINEKKSFVRSRFREACGVDAYDGAEIQPVYARYSVDALPAASSVGGLVSTANQLFLRGYYAASNYLEQEIQRALKRTLPVVARESGMLGWHDRQDRQTFGRYNSELMRLEVRAPVLVNDRRSDILDGPAALLKFFTETHNELRDFKCSNKRFSTRIRWRWLAA